MTGPRRLMDDPNFTWETGCDLADEALLHEGHDLSALKESVLANIAVMETPAGTGAASSGASWLKGVLAATGVVMVIGAAGVGYQVGRTAVAPLAPMAPSVEQATQHQAAPPVEEPAVMAPGTAEEHVAPSAVIGRAPEAAPRTTLERKTPKVAAAATVSARAVGTDEAPVELPTTGVGSVMIDETPPQASDAPRSSGLGDELNAYERAREAMVAGSYMEAATGFEGYLRSWPAGQLADEVRLSLLECMVKEGNWIEAQPLATFLLSSDAHAHRKGEISLLLAQSLVNLDRCSEALAIVDSIRPRPAEAANLRRACRRQK
jgi:TolA-binding protein